MSFSIIDAEQGSEAWKLARCGILTASKADCVLAKGKGKEESVTRRNLRLSLACQILTGQPEEDIFVNAAMAHGTAQEPFARAAFETRTGEPVRQTGFLLHDVHKAGASLDGSLENFKGIIELKAPHTSTHVEYWRQGGIPSKYMPQITHQLWITGAEYAYFGSFDPRLPPSLQLFLVRAERKEFDIDGYEAAALQFLSELEREVESLRELGNGKT